MATATITNTITTPGGTAVGGVRVTAALEPVPGFRTSDSVELADTVETYSNASGVWSLTLEKNADITPANTYYRIVEHVPVNGRIQRRVWNASVTVSQGLLASLVSPAGAQPAYDVTLASAVTRLGGTAGTVATLPFLNVKDYGALGDGATNDSAAILAAMTAVDATKGGVVWFPPGVYMCNNITIPNRQNLVLVGSHGATLKKNANGPMFTTPGSGWGQYLTFIEMALDGNGATYTGTGIDVGGSSAWFQFKGGRIVDTTSYCIKFTVDGAGAQSNVSACHLSVYQGQAGQANENVAVIYLPNDATTAPNRAFTDIQTNACLLFEDAGSQDSSWVGCHARNVNITGDPAKLFMSACRLASADAAITLRGTQNMYTGCAFAGAVTLGATSSFCAFDGNVVAGDITVTAGAGSNTLAGNTYSGTLTDNGTKTRIHQGDGTTEYPKTADPRALSATQTLNADQAVYMRARGRGLISKIGIHVGTASGNIAVAVYRNNGSNGTAARPDVRTATSGSVACPAAGYAEVSLGGSVYVEDGDWFAIVADNTTASFYRFGAGGFSSTIGNGVAHHQNTAMPPPATATPGTGALYSILMIGVP